MIYSRRFKCFIAVCVFLSLGLQSFWLTTTTILINPLVQKSENDTRRGDSENMTLVDFIITSNSAKFQKLQIQYFELLHKIHTDVQISFRFIESNSTQYYINEKRNSQLTVYLDENEILIIDNLVNRSNQIQENGRILCLSGHDLVDNFNSRSRS